jgi:hypothetical protein
VAYSEVIRECSPVPKYETAQRHCNDFGEFFPWIFLKLSTIASTSESRRSCHPIDRSALRVYRYVLGELEEVLSLWVNVDAEHKVDRSERNFVRVDLTSAQNVLQRAWKKYSRGPQAFRNSAALVYDDSIWILRYERSVLPISLKCHRGRSLQMGIILPMSSRHAFASSEITITPPTAFDI